MTDFCFMFRYSQFRLMYYILSQPRYQYHRMEMAAVSFEGGWHKPLVKLTTDVAYFEG